MEETNRGVIFMDLPAPSSSRSVSPMSPSPCREKNLGFFHALGRRFCRQSREDLSINGEDDSRSSSMDSCSSTSAGRLTSQEKDEQNLSIELSCSGSDTSSETTKSNTQRSRSSKRSSSSIKRALQNLSLSSRSLSCSSTPLKNLVIKPKKVKVTTTPQRILRQPVSYTYLKGMSGLPTQRVPRSSICCSHTCR